MRCSDPPAILASNAGKASACPPAVENLRQLILCGLLPGHPMGPQAAGEPEDDLTPTPSVVSTTSHPWDPGSPERAPSGGGGDGTQLPGPEGAPPEQEDVPPCSLGYLPPRTRNSGIWETSELDENPREEASSTEAAGSYQVVRRGNVNPPVEFSWHLRPPHHMQGTVRGAVLASRAADMLTWR